MKRTARYDYKYTLGELTEIKLMIEEHFNEIDEIHIIFNNHPGGKAVINALELNALLDKEIYASLKRELNLFPELRKVDLN